MTNKRPHVPLGLPIAGVILLVAGILLQPVFSGLPEDLLKKNVILLGVPFILIFVAIILFYMTVIWFVTATLNNRIAQRIHKPIENVIIAGIVLSVIAMFQPWLFIAYRIGFHTLLFFTLTYILWSHVIPKGIRRQQEKAAVSAGEIAAGADNI
jgi:hypothetical protein